MEGNNRWNLQTHTHTKHWCHYLFSCTYTNTQKMCSGWHFFCCLIGQDERGAGPLVRVCSDLWSDSCSLRVSANAFICFSVLWRHTYLCATFMSFHACVCVCVCMGMGVSSVPWLTSLRSHTPPQLAYRAPCPAWRPSGCLWTADQGSPLGWSLWFPLGEDPSQGTTGTTRGWRKR